MSDVYSATGPRAADVMKSVDAADLRWARGVIRSADRVADVLKNGDAIDLMLLSAAFELLPAIDVPAAQQVAKTAIAKCRGEALAVAKSAEAVRQAAPPIPMRKEVRRGVDGKISAVTEFFPDGHTVVKLISRDAAGRIQTIDQETVTSTSAADALIDSYRGTP